MLNPPADMRLVDDASEIIGFIDRVGLAYMHSSGCAVLKDGTWLQPHQWAIWLEHLRELEEEACL